MSHAVGPSFFLEKHHFQTKPNLFSSGQGTIEAKALCTRHVDQKNNKRSIEMSLKLTLGMIGLVLTGAVLAKAEESFSDRDCKKADGYSTVLLEKVADGIGVPVQSIKYEGAFIGGPVGNCAGLFSTPKGSYECALSPFTTDGGKSYFIGVPSAGLMAGMSNLCRKAK